MNCPAPQDYRHAAISQLSDYLLQLGRLDLKLDAPFHGLEWWGMLQVEMAQQNKVVYIMGRVDLMASTDLNFLKRVVLEYFYNPMERNCRTQTDSWNIPRSRLIEVGMSYDL